MSPGPIQLDQATALTLMLGPNGSVGIQASLLHPYRLGLYSAIAVLLSLSTWLGLVTRRIVQGGTKDV